MISITMGSYAQATEETETPETSREAETPNVELNLTPTVQVEQDAKTVTLILSLGAFQGIAEESTLAYQGNVTYDSNIFEKVEAEGISPWQADYSDTSKIIQGDTAKAKSNTQITSTLKMAF